LEMFLLATAEGARKRGFARRVVGAIVAKARSAQCSDVVASVSQSAVAFFRVCGFVKVNK
jgi:N-acetylglutamate synthase-like GNAT family acetyltransferase